MTILNHTRTTLRYGDEAVRTFLDEDNVLWFVASDLARVLGFSTGSSFARAIPEEERTTWTVETHGGRQKCVLISDSGLFVFATRTRKPFGRRLQRWITHEAMPTMCRLPQQNEDLTDPTREAQRILDFALRRRLS